MDHYVCFVEKTLEVFRLFRVGLKGNYRVRATPEWKKHAADLESEMLKRGMMFDVIEWDEGQEKLPFE